MGKSGLNMTPPKGFETWAISPPSLAKRACLLFDRIWVPSDFMVEHLDKSIDFGRDHPPPEFSFSDKDDDKQSYLSDILGLEEDELYQLDDPEIYSVFQGVLQIPGTRSGARHFMTSRFEEKGKFIVNLFDSESEMQQTYQKGSHQAYVAALNHIPLVSNDIPWEKVIEFRKDSEAVNKYRNLRLWLHDSLTADSVEHATDLIAKRIDDYTASIKKHGLLFVVGSVKDIFDANSALMTVSAGALGSMLVGPTCAAILAGVSIAGKTAASLAERYIEYKSERTSGSNHEIAVLYDIQREFKGSD